MGWITLADLNGKNCDVRSERIAGVYDRGNGGAGVLMESGQRIEVMESRQIVVDIIKDHERAVSSPEPGPTREELVEALRPLAVFGERHRGSPNAGRVCQFLNRDGSFTSINVGHCIAAADLVARYDATSPVKESLTTGKGAEE